MSKVMNGYDARLQLNEEVQRFIRKYKGRLEEKGIGNANKNSMKVVLKYKEFYEYYRWFVRISQVIFFFLSHIDEVEYGIKINFLRIKTSVKKQKCLMNMIKDICKKTAISTKEMEVFIRCLDDSIRRIDYIYTYVWPEYLNITPACAYVKKLKEQGISFQEDVAKYLETEEIDFDNEAEELVSYCSYIMALCEDDEEWKKNLSDLKVERQRRLEFAVERNQQAKEEKLAKRRESAQELLNAYISNLSRLCDNTAYLDGNCTAKRLRIQVPDFSKRGEKCKAIIVLKSGARSTTNVRFYAKTSDTLLGGGSIATVVNADMPLPEILQKQVDNGEIVFGELALN